MMAQVLGDIILPLVAKVGQRLGHVRGREAPAAARSLRMAAGLLSKGLLQHLTVMAPVPQFADLWARSLLAFQVAPCSCRHFFTAGIHMQCAD